MEFSPIKTDNENTAKNNKAIEELNKNIEFKTQEFKEYEIGNLEKKYTDKYLQTKLQQSLKYH